MSDTALTAAGLLPTGDDSPPCPRCARFTQADVAMLRESAEDDSAAYDNSAKLRDLADRLATLIATTPPT